MSEGFKRYASEQYVDNAIKKNNIVLKSESGKEFIITVDDFGKLKAVENKTIEEALIDFEYVDNGNGTYTITDWKGTTNGVDGVDIIIPDQRYVIV